MNLNLEFVPSSTVMEHLNYTWKRSKGVQPRELFSDLHLALESDLFKELVGKELARVCLISLNNINKHENYKNRGMLRLTGTCFFLFEIID
jgi:hypothetical protein